MLLATRVVPWDWQTTTKVPSSLPAIGDHRLTREFTVAGQFQETQVY